MELLTPMASLITEDTIVALRKRNEERVVIAKENLGTKYLMHPENRVKKLKVPRSTINGKQKRKYTKRKNATTNQM